MPCRNHYGPIWWKRLDLNQHRKVGLGLLPLQQATIAERFHMSPLPRLSALTLCGGGEYSILSQAHKVPLRYTSAPAHNSGCAALLSVVSQFLSVCIPSGCRKGATLQSRLSRAGRPPASPHVPQYAEGVAGLAGFRNVVTMRPFPGCPRGA